MGAPRLIAVAVMLLAVWVTACSPPRLAPVSERKVIPEESTGSDRSASAPATVAPATRKPAHSRRPASHTVHRGETLYSIAWQFGVDYRALAKWNRIRAPYTIHPGDRLALRPKRLQSPVSSSKSASPAKKTVAKTPKKAVVPRPIVRSKEKTVTKKQEQWQRLRWYWPTKGPIKRKFSTTRSGKRGIDIGGRVGDPVRAAAAGTVVYSGSGLVGYGRLIILKHNKEFLSAYAHNDKLLVKENERVKAGQIIARLGSSGVSEPMLHFEIRRSGNPVDPLRYLPRRR